ncbi:MAG TPA: double-strand break repair protein AddB, partial [Hyphomicrobiales bacterium]|nr:double-strand break repair protein AddB [Hyphomicrobiales bacterium]
MDKPATAGGDTARVWTIAPGDAFLPRLARALIDGALIGEKPSAADQAARSASPFALAEATVLLPTRRACRALGDALVEANGGAPLLLPAIRALGDVDLAELALQGGAPGDDELAADFPDQRAFADLPPPAIGALERVVTLGRLIEAWGEKVSPAEPDPTRDAAMRKPGSAAMAVRLAGDLAHFMDSLETEGIDPARLAEIVPEGFSRHWQVTLDFLQIVSGAWPEHLGQRGLISPAARRDLLLAMETRRLARLRPAAPVIAAGSTGSIPATADLLGTIARLPAGAVVLPGLDLDSDEGDWSGILAAPSHPQHGMALLLARIGVSRDQVRALGAAPRASRAALAREAMRPAPRTDSWHLALDGSTPHRLAGAGQGLTLIAARTIEEEALAIALAMRECIETAGQSAALITPDRALARRVAAELGRWNLTVDDSAGISLAATPPGLFARLVAEIMCEGLRPVPLLALLKHPLAGLGMAPAELRRAARILEIAVLRGPRLAPDLAALRTRLAGARANSESGADRDPARARLGAADWELAGALVERLAAALAASGMAGIEQSRAPLAELFARHRALCENFAGNERTGGSALPSRHGGFPHRTGRRRGRAAARCARHSCAGGAFAVLGARQRQRG